MDLLLDDYSEARNLMVDGQVRPNRVTDPRIIAAMRHLPRHLFVPPAARARAYADEDVPLGGGRVLVEPMVIARLVQIAAVREGERALVVGAGSGYGAALLAACGATVTALEEDAGLRDLARSALAGVAGVSLVAGPLVEGWSAGAPYDVILVEGAAEELPPALAAQLRTPGGRLVGVLTGAHIGRAVLGEPSAGGLSLRPQFDCATPTLPALRRRPAFVF
jgi:protein-L-isoaspartate(D-aspartate) O-methyltransferase